MDLETLRQHIQGLSLEDRLLLIEELREGLAGQFNESELTDSERDELDRRLLEDDLDPADTVSWEEVKAVALARIRRGM